VQKVKNFFVKKRKSDSFAQLARRSKEYQEVRKREEEDWRNEPPDGKGALSNTSGTAFKVNTRAGLHNSFGGQEWFALCVPLNSKKPQKNCKRVA
jgi:hypothetical protein